MSSLLSIYKISGAGNLDTTGAICNDCISILQSNLPRAGSVPEFSIYVPDWGNFYKHQLISHTMHIKLISHEAKERVGYELVSLYVCHIP